VATLLYYQNFSTLATGWTIPQFPDDASPDVLAVAAYPNVHCPETTRGVYLQGTGHTLGTVIDPVANGLTASPGSAGKCGRIWHDQPASPSNYGGGYAFQNNTTNWQLDDVTVKMWFWLDPAGSWTYLREFQPFAVSEAYGSAPYETGTYVEFGIETTVGYSQIYGNQAAGVDPIDIAPGAPMTAQMLGWHHYQVYFKYPRSGAAGRVCFYFDGSQKCNYTSWTDSTLYSLKINSVWAPEYMKRNTAGEIHAHVMVDDIEIWSGDALSSSTAPPGGGTPPVGSITLSVR
jgi:hypothetical protein